MLYTMPANAEFFLHRTKWKSASKCPSCRQTNRALETQAATLTQSGCSAVECQWAADVCGPGTQTKQHAFNLLFL